MLEIWREFEGKQMRMASGIGLAILAGVLVAPLGVAKVYVRWTESTLPPVKVLGVNELVIDWSEDAKPLLEKARKLGYRVYLEVTLDQAAKAADAGGKTGASGIVLMADATKQGDAEESANKLRAAHPKLKILVLNPGGKQPAMRGWLVFKKNGILQVSSPTSQPWLDTNLALARYEEGFQKTQAPLYTFSWDVSDPLVKELGPHSSDYTLAIAEAGAFHADLILEVHERQQKGLISRNKNTLADWETVKRTIAFYQRGDGGAGKEEGRVAVLTDNYESPYEALNLMARHNIAYRVLRSSEVKAEELGRFDVVIAFSELGKELTEAIGAFAEKGGVAVLVKLKGPYPWESTANRKMSGHTATYAMGKGCVIELDEAVTDPETFAQDIRRLMTKEQIPVSLWNSLTMLVAAYPGQKKDETIVELVNYAEESTQVQVQVQGKFGTVRYESPEKGCCEKLKPSVVGGFTEFVVPGVVVSGRVHLSGAAAAADKIR